MRCDCKQNLQSSAVIALLRNGETLGCAVFERSSWLPGCAVFALSVASLGFVSQFQSLVIERGLAVQTAPLLLSALAASVFVSRLVIGWALDRYRPERVAAGALLLAAFGMHRVRRDP